MEYYHQDDEEELEEEKENGITMLPTEEIDNVFETLKVILPISVDKFFQTFIADEAEFSFVQFYRDRGDTEIEFTTWVEDEEISAFSRELKYRTKIPGPSVGPSTTRAHRAQIYRKSEGLFELRSSLKALDAPYCSYFSIQEDWYVTEVADDKCMLRCTTGLTFSKSTIFKGKIESRAKSDVTKDTENWLNKARKFIDDVAIPAHSESATKSNKPRPARKGAGSKPKKEGRKGSVQLPSHQIAKYAEVDLKQLSSSSKFVKSKMPFYKNTDTLVIVNSVLLVLLFLYHWHLRNGIEGCGRLGV